MRNYPSSRLHNRFTLTLRDPSAQRGSGGTVPGGFGRVGLGLLRARDLTLACQLYCSLIPVLRARQRCKEADEIVDLGFG